MAPFRSGPVRCGAVPVCPARESCRGGPEKEQEKGREAHWRKKACETPPLEAIESPATGLLGNLLE